VIIIYIDESGDDGTKPGSSPILSLGCVKFEINNWLTIYQNLENLFRDLTTSINPSFKKELHTHDLLCNKGIYKDSPLDSVKMNRFFNEIIKFINTHSIRVSTYTIIKNANTPTYPLRKVLIEAIKNDIGVKRLIISDRGRVPLMRSIAQFARDNKLVDEYLIENIVESESKFNRFVQLADFFATVAYIHAAQNHGINIHSRIAQTSIQLINQITEEANLTFSVVRP
jgi:hypothetical protein